MDVDEVDCDVKVPQSPSHQCQDFCDPGVLPTYKWNPSKQTLVPVVPLPLSHPIQDTAEGDEEEHPGEDDATLVPSEDGHVHDRLATQYFS